MRRKKWITTPSPDPWSVRNLIGDDGEVVGRWIVDEDGNMVVRNVGGDSLKQITLNAQLIAAAPILFLELSKAVGVYHLNHCHKCPYRDKTSWECVCPIDKPCWAKRWNRVLGNVFGKGGEV